MGAPTKMLRTRPDGYCGTANMRWKKWDAWMDTIDVAGLSVPRLARDFRGSAGPLLSPCHGHFTGHLDRSGIRMRAITLAVLPQNPPTMVPKGGVKNGFSSKAFGSL